MSVLDDETYIDLDEWMEQARKLGDKYPELEAYVMNATFPVFRDFYMERGINPAGNPIRSTFDRSTKHTE